MSTYTTPAVHRPNLEQQVERIVLALLAILAVIAVATGARITWELPDTATSDAAPSVPAAAIERAARVEVVAAELHGLQETVRVVPATEAVLAERMELLRLVVDGTLPIAAAEAPPAPAVLLQQLDVERTAAVIGARQELTALRTVVRTTPSVAAGLARDMATLDAIGHGLVPPEAMLVQR